MSIDQLATRTKIRVVGVQTITYQREFDSIAEAAAFLRLQANEVKPYWVGPEVTEYECEFSEVPWPDELFSGEDEIDADRQWLVASVPCGRPRRALA